VAILAAFTANGTAGPYTVTATVAGASTPASFSLENAAVAASSSNYSFYLSGLEVVNEVTAAPNFYALAGSVSIDANGNVLGGEQDYNDAAGFTSREPSGDTITGGSLTADAKTGQGTLALVTSNPSIGVGGTVTFGVQFVNANHALIVQFDGTATSSGSLDLQTLPNPLAPPASGGYAFTLSGVDISYNPVVFGGVFTISGATISQGVYDEDDSGTVTLGNAFPSSGVVISTPDSFGRGTITGAKLGGVVPDTGAITLLSYYIVGPEVIRIMDVDTSTNDSGVGSAFSQGSGKFSSASLGSSVFAVSSNSYGDGAIGTLTRYAAAGSFTTTTTTANSGTFQGVADADELHVLVAFRAPISGTYSIASTESSAGYGSLTIPLINTAPQLGDISKLGIYMTDPSLNLLDPNNTTSGLGGALIADLDTSLNGTGVLIPQTAASFAGNYAFGAQDYNEPKTPSGSGEFDFVGQGSVTDLALTGTGLVSDPTSFFSSKATDTNVNFSGTAVADGDNPGRYEIQSLAVTVGTGSPIDFSVVIYQANGGQLFWLYDETESVFLGSLQQQGSLTGLPQARKAAAKTKRNRNNSQ